MSTDINKILKDIKTLLDDDEEIGGGSFFLSGEKRKQAPRVYTTVHTDRRDFFVKSATDLAGREGLRREYETLSRLRIKGFQTPRPFELFNWGMVMLKLNGTSLDRKIEKVPISFELRSSLERVILCISLFHLNARGDMPTTTSLEKTYKELTGKDISSETMNLMTQASLGFTHGDLDPFNLLLTDSPDSELALIDWEDFRQDGVQELDIINFIIMLAVVMNPNVSHRDLYDIVFKSGGLYMDLLQTYCSERGISLSTIQQFVPMYCDTQNYRLTKANRSTEEFLYNVFKECFYDSR